MVNLHTTTLQYSDDETRSLSSEFYLQIPAEQKLL